MKKVWILVSICILFLAGCSHTESDFASESTEDVEKPEEAFSILWEEQDIIIPELSNDYEVWFMADSHMIIPDENADEQVRAYEAERMPVFTNEAKIASSEIFTEFIEQANAEKPDLILFGGDILDFPSEKNIAFLKDELEKLTIPYLFVMGNHDWTYPWEYMTPEGAEKYRPLVEEITGMNSYAGLVEWEDIVFLAVDNSSNQVAPEAVPVIEQAYATRKPIVLVQHVPFSTENLIARAKEDWQNPVTLGMQVHGGIPVNAVSDALYKNALDDESQIRLVLAGHVHFAYSEQMSENTTEIIADAAFKGKAVKLHLTAERE